MQTGRKILNLRCDRKVSQQDLARACEITPSALSKIEAGINSPRANIIWRIARNLGVTVEYLLDEGMPYPYPGHSYRHELLHRNVDPGSTVRAELTREEKAFVDALRSSHEIAREIAFSIPEAPVETVRLVHFLLNHSKVNNPTQPFLKAFESLLTTGAVPAPPPAPVAKRGSGRSNPGSGVTRKAASNRGAKKAKATAQRQRS